MKAKQYPSQNEIREWFEYRDGGLYWKINKTNKIKIGYRAGTIATTKYRRIVINQKFYAEHRLIWIYFNGDVPDGLQIDHINRIKYDNRIENLRLVTNAENALNRNSKNVIERNKLNNGKSYMAHCTINGEGFSKTFDTEQKAIDWVVEKKAEIFEKIH